MADELKPTEKLPEKRPGTIRRVSYGITVNIGNFETVRFELSADVDPHAERWQDVMARLRGLCDKQKHIILKDHY